MSFKLAEAFVELKTKGAQQAKSDVDALILKTKDYSKTVEVSEKTLKKYEDQIKKSGEAGKSFSDTLGDMGLKFGTLAKGVGGAVAALVLLDRAGQNTKGIMAGLGSMVDDATRKMLGFKTAAEEAQIIGGTLAGGSQLQTQLNRQFERFMSGNEGMSGADASRILGGSGLTFEQEDQIDARQNAIDMQRRKIEESMQMIQGKAKSGIFSGLEQMGVTDQSSAQRQLQNLRDQKNALGELMEDTFTMRDEMKKMNELAAQHEDIDRKIADQNKDREERIKRIADYEEKIRNVLEAQQKGRDAAAKEEMARRAGAVADVVKETRRGGEFVALEEMARRAQGAAGSSERDAQKASIEAAKELKKLNAEGLKLKEYPYARMSR